MAVKFSDATLKEFDEIVSRYPRRDAALLPTLWLAQREFGYLSQETCKYVADLVGVSLAKVESVVSFYTLYKTKPVGKYHIQLCRNISCNLRGCEGLMSMVESELGLKPGETTADGQFSYELVECLAACGGAPALQVNRDYHERLTPEKVKELIHDYKKGKR